MVLRTGKEVIEKVYGVPGDQLRVFFHYHPQFYHLHVHFTRSHVNPGCEAERAHLLTDVIQVRSPILCILSIKLRLHWSGYTYGSCDLMAFFI